MAFTIYDKQAGGQSGELGPGNAGELVEIWIFVADNGNHTPENLRNSGLLPRVYEDRHPSNQQLLCRPHKIDQNEENPALFIVTVTWTSEPLSPEEKEKKDDSPLDSDPKISVETAFEVQYSHTDAKGKAKTNSAGDLFDPTTPSRRSFRVIKIRKNVAVFPDWVFDFDDCVNSSPVMIKNRMFPAGYLYLAKITLGEETPHPRGSYSEANLEIWHKLPREPRQGENPALIPLPWRSEVLDEGLHGCNPLRPTTSRYRIMIPNESGAMVYPAGPVPLDNAGNPLPSASSMTAETYISKLEYRIYDDHREKDFNSISFLWAYRSF